MVLFYEKVCKLFEATSSRLVATVKFLPPNMLKIRYIKIKSTIHKMHQLEFLARTPA